MEKVRSNDVAGFHDLTRLQSFLETASLALDDAVKLLEDLGLRSWVEDLDLAAEHVWNVLDSVWALMQLFEDEMED